MQPSSFRFALVLSALAVSSFLPLATAQHTPTAQQLAGIAKDNARHFGDDPDDPGPLAKDLSPSTSPKDVAAAMRKVADWQLQRSQPYFDRIWTWSVLYSGFVAAADALDEPRYRNAMEAVGRKYNWELRSHLPDADDQSIGQTYLELYLRKKDPAMMLPTQKELDALIAAPRLSNIPNKEIAWWWCDALFMAPPVWARMYKATGDGKYLAYLDEEWERTANRLYDTKEHLYARDASYFTRTEANGKKMFWSRGNGWVMGGLIRTLRYLPQGDPKRAFYVEQLREMAARVAELQGADGLWRAGMLDSQSYDQPEVSGSALFTYALAAGVNDGLLDRKKYTPVIRGAWAGMIHHVYADGRLGCVQQTGAEPAPFKASASYTYGVGAFLLAGSEVLHLQGQ